MVSVYPISTHWVVGRPVPKWFEMLGRATATLPMSETDVNRPIARARNAQ